MLLTFHGWRFRVDLEATKAAYSKSGSRGAEECSCAYCRNFVSQRDREYPAELLRFLHSAGVDPLKEAEVWEVGPLDDGYSYNAGWWHFIGEVETEGKEAISLPTQPFGNGREWKVVFLPNQAALKLDTLPESPLVQVDFSVELPWVLNEPYPSA